MSVLLTTILGFLYVTKNTVTSSQSSSSSIRTNGSVSISGLFDINGQVPQNASITVLARRDGEKDFKVVVSNVSAVDGGAWEFIGASKNDPYDLQAVINSGGQTVATSNTITVVAPADSEVLRFNIASQQASKDPASISGTIGLNGYIPSGSVVTVSARQTGTGPFITFLSNLPATDGTTWSYTAGLSGTSYDIQASLQTNGVTLSQSQILTALAPASLETLTINAQNQPAAPRGNSMTNTCVGKNPSTNLWQVQFTYNNNNAVPGVQQYLLSVGNTQVGNQFVNNQSSPSSPGSPNQTRSYTTGFVFTEGQSYYAQWAYATCASCNTFSQPSTSLQFYCTTPLPSSTPIPTNTPSPTINPPTDTPVPTH